MDEGRREGVRTFDERLKAGLVFLAAAFGIFAFQKVYSGLQMRQYALVGEFRQMQEGGLAVAHKGAEGFGIERRNVDAVLFGKLRGVLAVP